MMDADRVRLLAPSDGTSSGPEGYLLCFGVSPSPRELEVMSEPSSKQSCSCLAPSTCRSCSAYPSCFTCLCGILSPSRGCCEGLLCCHHRATVGHSITSPQRRHVGSDIFRDAHGHHR
ncbi:hypothetical protein BDP55DRAFT_671448 [Colletotrichum godetiae]|uniref:Uncharacterized protein n=1 Tax=Colletotrichum godetiae TaxID=1209918 RepID=A0AAJ0EV71_9PEZI|nr:uncharacterized protein BDP55DRAFT_671448 [Colletotrichum godetiae]KAK1672939.1 hypothetical protein BDP55DRAFT_671448 [Colletotrichum godetiae]